MKRWFTTFVFSASLLFVSSQALTAQGVTTGAITGTVVGPDGEAMANVQISVRNNQTGYTTGTLTRSTGQYLLQGLEVGGPYTVSATSIGFEGRVRNDIYIRLSQSTRVDFALSVQAVEVAGIDVTVARTADFSPTRQGVDVQVSDTLVARVPTFSRDFVDLLKLAPQVTYPGTGAASGGGAYNRYNTITIDGANQSERFNLSGTGGVPGGSAGGKIVSLDAVKEFRVSFTPTDVRQGNFAGMLVNAVSKSGTNDLRGGALFTYRSNQDLIGLNLVGEEFRNSEFDVKQYGFHVGGPIIKDRLHFFIAPEWQQRAAPAGGPFHLQGGGVSVQAPTVPLDSLNRIAQIVQNQYGFDVGVPFRPDNETPLTNLFGRLDFQINGQHRAVLRQIYNKSEQDEFFNDTDTHNTSALNQTQGQRFSSNAFVTEVKNSSTVGQLYSNFSSRASNELIVGYSTIRTERLVPVQAPEVSVGVNVGGTVRAVTFGTEQFSPGNLLDQDIFEIVNNFTYATGNHTFTVGGRLDHTQIFNNFAQGSFGVYKFATIAALEAGTPQSYAVGYANSGRAADIPADFRVQMGSLYAQDQWSLTDRFTLTAGLRADIPRMLDAPPQNDTLTAAFDTITRAGAPTIRTDGTPKTRVLFSPRLGFNWDPTGDQQNQVRGGIGIYTGPPPYILLGNAYANTGLGLVRLACGVGGASGTTPPAFTLDVNSLPTACAGGTPPPPGQAGTLGVNTTDPDFKFPQYFGMSAGFDRRLPFNTVLTVEALYRKAINGVLVRDRNLIGPRLANGAYYTDVNGRVLYADTISATGSVTNNNQRWVRTMRGVGFTEGVIDVTNQSKDYNYSISTQLNRRFSDRFEATLAYTYMQSKDVQSLTSDRAISNFRNGRQLSGAHEDLEVTSSNFERPHRVLAYGTYTFPWKITDVTLYYEGSSGLPFVYVSNDDLNGDLVTFNDPIYVPNNALDPNEIRIGTGVGAAFVQNAVAAQAFEDFIDAQPCLDEQRGQIMERNSCRSPFQHRFDLSVRQSIPEIRGQQVTLQLDIFNFLNFLNKDWGQIKLPTLSPVFNNQAALDATGRGPGALNSATSIPTFTFDNRLYDSDVESSTFGDPTPFEGRTGSVYQIQLTLRYSF
ncbi:MAG TPA: carboxypeptidase regulatory-like domain-containing protein [Longimicrobiales bacterium]